MRSRNQMPSEPIEKPKTLVQQITTGGIEDSPRDARTQLHRRQGVWQEENRIPLGLKIKSSIDRWCVAETGGDVVCQ